MFKCMNIFVTVEIEHSFHIFHKWSVKIEILYKVQLFRLDATYENVILTTAKSYSETFLGLHKLEVHCTIT